MRKAKEREYDNDEIRKITKQIEKDENVKMKKKSKIKKPKKGKGINDILDGAAIFKVQ